MLQSHNAQDIQNQLLAEANRLRLSGKAGQALAKLKQLLSKFPGHVAGNLAWAELMTARGEQEQALAALRRAAENAPSNVSVWTRYVVELRTADKKARARKAAERARVPAAQRKILKDIAAGRSVPVDDIADQIRRGDTGGAWATGLERLAHFPLDPRLLNLLGVAALTEDDPIRAEPLLRRALDADASHDAARGNLGLALLRQGRSDEAIATLEPYARPGAAQEVRVNLASAYQKIGRLQEADRLTAELLRETPEDSEVLGVRSKTLVALGRGVEAVKLLEPLARAESFRLHDVLAEALGETEGYEAGLKYLADVPEQKRDDEVRIVSLLAEWGELEPAVARARRLADRIPNDPEPFRLLGLFSRWDASDPLIGSMESGLSSEDIPPVKRGAFGLALAKARMDAGEDDAAMSALVAGNGLLRSLYDYDVEADEAHMREIAAFWTARAIAERQTSLDEPAPIFIVGLPRSGSTLIETILSRHPAIQPLGESPVAYDIASKSRLVADHLYYELAGRLAVGLTPRTGKRAVTDKLLANFLNIGVLAACFPQARFVEMRRDYRSTCLSIYQSGLNLAAHPYACDLEELARYAVAYDRLMAHWAEVLGPRLLRVEYRSLVTSAEPEIRRILSALNLDWNPDCLRPEDAVRRIETLSVGQARKPISAGSLERWKRFETGLAPLTRVLEDAGVV